ncbi:MAG: DJ-1/PfpI family protein [Candidatus Magasanikbacteria bacterium]|nr:DJ-1/PfpI family protein [Candidatus Magasanikbacteria bacterium]
MPKKVLLIIAFEDFQPVECFETKALLEKGGLEVELASDKIGEATAVHTKEKVDIKLSVKDVVVDNYDGVFLIGGPGAMERLDNSEVYQAMKEAKEKGKIWGAICIAPRILANADLLQGQKVTGWNGDGNLKDILHQAGAEYINKKSLIDGKLVTASGPEAVPEFAQSILEVI